jgi:hypothetical protein
MEGANVIGVGTLSTTGGITTATLMKSDFPVGNHTVTAEYGGDANFAPSVSDGQIQTVNPSDTQTVVTRLSPAGNSDYGDPVTFRATVSAVAPGAGPPTGTVDFFADGTQINETVNYSVEGGVLRAELTVKTLRGRDFGQTFHDNQIQAQFSDPSGNFNPSDNSAAPFIHRVNAAPVLMHVVSSKNPSMFGDPVTFTATVLAGPGRIFPPGGSVFFHENGNPLPNGQVNLDESSQATYTIPNPSFGPLPVGITGIRADYDGDQGYEPLVPGGELIGGQKVVPRVNPGDILISEIRFNGTNHDPANCSVPGQDPCLDWRLNDFVELYNNTDTDLTAIPSDNSNGWGVFGADGSLLFTVFSGTVLPARGHFLGVNPAGYSLESYAVPDATFTQDLIDGAAVFTTDDPSAVNLGNRLDAVGYDTADDLHKEGGGISSNAGGQEQAGPSDSTFFRDLRSGSPKDTDHNAEDFLGADTNSLPTNLGTRLGAPGPETLFGPITHNELDVSLLDPTVPRNTPPNRARDVNDNRGSHGVLFLRRRITNNTNKSIIQLRLRVTDITTNPAPLGTADLRALDESGLGGPVQVTVHDPSRCGGAASCDLPVQPLTLEHPPAQPNGGGWNSSLAVGTVTLFRPLGPGESVDVEVALAVEQTGAFRFTANLEALLLE